METTLGLSPSGFVVELLISTVSENGDFQSKPPASFPPVHAQAQTPGPRFLPPAAVTPAQPRSPTCSPPFLGAGGSKASPAQGGPSNGAAVAVLCLWLSCGRKHPSSGTANACWTPQPPAPPRRDAGLPQTRGTRRLPVPPVAAQPISTPAPGSGAGCRHGAGGWMPEDRTCNCLLQQDWHPPAHGALDPQPGARPVQRDPADSCLPSGDGAVGPALTRCLAEPGCPMGCSSCRSVRQLRAAQTHSGVTTPEHRSPW